jgi:hypothetical protein
LDRPFTITEYNYTAPNAFTAEGGLLLGAYSALQDWGGLWRFAYAHRREKLFRPAPLDYFDGAADPLRTATEYAFHALFLRRDLSPARRILSVTDREKTFLSNAHHRLHHNAAWLSWSIRLGSLIGTPRPSPDRLDLPIASAQRSLSSIVEQLKKERSLPKYNGTDPDQGIYESDHGQVRLEATAGILTVVTTRTVGAAGPEGTMRRLGPFTVFFNRSWAALWATALDEQPLPESDRILLVHLTDIKNTGMKLSGKDHQVLEAWGRTPYLVKTGTASVSLCHRRAATLRIWRLDLSGRRVSRVPSRALHGAIEFTVTTATRPDATFYYEIT